MSVTNEDTSSVILLTDRFEKYENLNKEYIPFKEIGQLRWYRGYYMAAWRYEISLLVLKNISRVSAALKYFFCYERRDWLCSHSNGDLFTCENNMLFSRVKICFAQKLTYWCLYLTLINWVGGLYGRTLTEVASTDRTQWGLYQQPRSRFSHTDWPSSVNKMIIWPNKKAKEQKHK